MYKRPLSARRSITPVLACLVIAPVTLAESFKPVTEVNNLPEAPALLTLNNRVSALPDGPLFINIWASWCKPCVDELPALNALKARYPHADIHWVALNYGDSLATVREFMTGTEIELPVLLDLTTQFTAQLPLTGLPATFLADAHGQIRYQLDGYADWTDPTLTRQLESLLPELTNPQ